MIMYEDFASYFDAYIYYRETMLYWWRDLLNKRIKGMTASNFF